MLNQSHKVSSSSIPSVFHRQQFGGVCIHAPPKHAWQQIAESVYLDHSLPPAVGRE
jgi:hypothetical protein